MLWFKFPIRALLMWLCCIVANDNAPEYALRPGFLSTFALATDQGSKLGLSKNKSIICYYNTYQVFLPHILRKAEIPCVPC